MSRCQFRYWPADDDDAEGTLWLIDPESRSWASLRHHPERPGRYEVRQHGPRMLFDEVEAAYRWWVDLGAPAVDRWRITVSSAGRHVWLADERGECLWSSTS